MIKLFLSILILCLTSGFGFSMEVTKLLLIDAQSNQTIREIQSDDVIDLANTDRGINIKADTTGEVECVRFALNDNSNFQTENVSPYALKGDNNGNYSNWVPAPGKYTIVATPYSESNANGKAGKPLSITITIKGKPKYAIAGPKVVESQYPDITSEDELEEFPPAVGGKAKISGDLKRWHGVVLTFGGPETSETASPNPFFHYRLNVTFSQNDLSFVFPGYYAGDGNGEPNGNKWRVRFSPPKTGTWNYKASFRGGYNINTRLETNAGIPTSFDGAKGHFTVNESNKSDPDFRAPENGLLINRGHHYLSFGGSGKFWIKGGPDIPENFLGYDGFENTPNPHHSYDAHLKDWQSGDPDWGNGNGKRIIGALNYIAKKGGNCLYFLPMNIGGDGKDTFPTIAPYEKTRYDNSKLQQWEILFSHAQSLGIFLHFQLAETEHGNENYHDDGELGPERKLFYRELIARFGHHNGIEFNIGEENDYGTERRVQFARYIKAVDPYNHPVVVHTHSGKEIETYDPFLDKIREGEEIGIDMTSFQGGRSERSMANLITRFRNLSAEVGHPWVVSFDEPQAIHNDKKDKERGYDMARRKKMWPAYMGGAGGFEWYVQQDGGGHGLDHRLDNFAEMELALRWADNARQFLYNLPLDEIEPNHELGDADEGKTYVLAKPGTVYAVYNDSCGKNFELNLSKASGRFTVKWFDPRGTAGFAAREKTIHGGAKRDLGNAPYDLDQDWACLVETVN